jgi:hypothetical protein
MSHVYLNTSTVPARMSKDGFAGEKASIYIPFFGRYYFSGATFNYAQSRIPQDKSRFISGAHIPGEFHKGFTGQCGV